MAAGNFFNNTLTPPRPIGRQFAVGFGPIRWVVYNPAAHGVTSDQLVFRDVEFLFLMQQVRGMVSDFPEIDGNLMDNVGSLDLIAGWAGARVFDQRSDAIAVANDLFPEAGVPMDEDSDDDGLWSPPPLRRSRAVIPADDEPFVFGNVRRALFAEEEPQEEDSDNEAPAGIPIQRFNGTDYNTDDTNDITDDDEQELVNAGLAPAAAPVAGIPIQRFNGTDYPGDYYEDLGEPMPLRRDGDVWPPLVEEEPAQVPRQENIEQTPMERALSALLDAQAQGVIVDEVALTALRRVVFYNRIRR
jgi:hypothetical protein